MKIKMKDLKPGMRVKTKRGLRTVTGLKWRREFENGRVQYFWLADRIHPQNAEGIVGEANVAVEVADE